MSVSIHLTSSLRPESGGSTNLCVSAPTVRAALEQLEQSHPSLYRSVCDETGAVRRHINLFVNNTLLSGPNELDTRLDSGDILSIMTAVSGG